ncbi:hypothetical protein NC797_09070 [Aquibacillus sp. 3ASR75-11]|uniref:Uncharacterized protein n=1 Tax=Terrihalobacillus insolitus TaxID=2950438 RepID=A0A9X4ANL6_9BACI|nr:hypothetical protein [Terrihalobacillus insolitus]MDC3413583.1 hypothetical protein [Terrihalobacillus insolitus]MDC3424660.1 hypothetical protein [Terrihalobacillus insolitus]
MQVYATFEHSTYIELAIKHLEENGIQDIFAVPLDNRTEERKLFDTIHRSDGTSFIGTGMILAVFTSTIGANRGFVLEWGPIYWGVIGALIGFILGVIIDLIRYKIRKSPTKLLKGKNSEVILIIECQSDQGKLVEDILWTNLALGVAKVV